MRNKGSYPRALFKASHKFLGMLCLFCYALSHRDVYNSGPGCSKLTTLSVNVLLKFQMLASQIHLYFLLKKSEKLLQCSAKASHIFSTKNISVFGYKVVKHLMS